VRRARTMFSPDARSSRRRKLSHDQAYDDEVPPGIEPRYELFVDGDGDDGEFVAAG